MSRSDDDLSSIDPSGVNAAQSDCRRVDRGRNASERTVQNVGKPLHSDERLHSDEFERCYAEYGSGVRAALRARLANDLDVEDCLNRVFEKLWVCGGAIPSASRRAWLFVVARNEAALLGRKAGRQVHGKFGASAGTAQDEAFASRDPMPLESLLRQEEIERLRRAGRCLSNDQAEVLNCRFFEDLSFREIAQRLGIPLGTALSRARSAIKRLRNELNPSEEE